MGHLGWQNGATLNTTVTNLTDDEKEELKKSLIGFVQSVMADQIEHRGVRSEELHAAIDATKILFSSF